jgi:hypothetical protein
MIMTFTGMAMRSILMAAPTKANEGDNPWPGMRVLAARMAAAGEDMPGAAEVGTSAGVAVATNRIRRQNRSREKYEDNDQNG